MTRSKAIFGQDFGGRILRFDDGAAMAYAALLAQRRAKGRPIATADLVVADTERTHRATIVARNIGDFKHCWLDLIEP